LKHFRIMSGAILNLEKLFNIKISPEYNELFDDLYKFGIVFFAIVILTSYSDSEFAKLAKDSSLEVLLFTAIGLCAYHLVLKRLVTLS
jgi:hypothetical protein